MKNELVRMRYPALSPTINTDFCNPLLSAIYSLRDSGWNDSYFSPELIDNPVAILYRNDFCAWLVICDWVIKDRFKLFNLCDFPAGESHMLLMEPRAKVVIEELNIFEGIFDAFGSLNETQSLPWATAIDGWLNVQTEKKAEDLNRSSKKLGIRTLTDKLRDIKSSLTRHENPYKSMRTTKHRSQMCEIAISIANNHVKPLDNNHSKVKQRFRESFFNPYIEKLEAQIFSYRNGIEFPDGVCHRIRNVYLSGNANYLKVTCEKSTPERVFIEPRPSTSLTQRGKYSRA
jgi:hypothetical protein